MARYAIRPLDRWTDPQTADRRTSGVFKASYSDTLDLLSREAEHLGADLIVVQVVLRNGEQDIRRDGALRARAEVLHPGVVVSMDTSRGPLRFATDVHEQRWSGDLPSWQANLRAIALALEALRKIDRYGVTQRGEQYTGWKQIGGATPMPAPMTVESAAELLSRLTPATTHAILRSAEVRNHAYRRAMRATHPDTGGETADPELFRQVQEAKRLLDAERPAPSP